MRPIFLLAGIFSATALGISNVYAQKPTTAKAKIPLVGVYQGLLKASPSVALTLIFRVTGTEADPKATLDVPEQGLQGFAVTKTTVISDAVIFAMDKLGATFTGKRSADGKTITGTFTQNGRNFPLVLTSTVTPLTIERPQTPKPPFPYTSEEVSYTNPKAPEITLGGTLILPQGKAPFPVVLFITGSGQQDRDETIMGHKPFAVIADYLARRGIASLRVDDRGIGKSSIGDLARATSADFAGDTRAGVAYLKTRKEIDNQQIGLIGHSEGGLIAPMVAANNPDVAFIVLLAGTGVPGDQVINEQRDAINKASGITEAQLGESTAIMKHLLTVAKNTTDPAQVTPALQKVMEEEIAKLPSAIQTPAREQLAPSIKMMALPWFQYFLQTDPATFLQSVSCPVLALNGSLDMQVLPKDNLPGIEAALKKAGNKDVTIRELPGLNHLFQHAKTGTPAEYSTITETFSPEALTILGEWITKHTHPAPTATP